MDSASTSTGAAASAAMSNSTTKSPQERTRSRSPQRRNRMRKPSKSDLLVPRNSRGGIYVAEEDIDAAFRFLDSNRSGSITLGDLRKRLQPFYRDMPLSEYQFLMAGKKSLTAADLKELLIDNEISGFDPVAEAFKVYDPHGTGYANLDTIKELFQRLGFSDLSHDDISTLLVAADRDQDGRISLQDFRELLDLDVDEHIKSLASNSV